MSIPAFLMGEWCFGTLPRWGECATLKECCLWVFRENCSYMGESMGECLITSLLFIFKHIKRIINYMSFSVSEHCYIKFLLEI